MTDQIKLVKNPLTIIAIFAGLAEVASTAALAALDKDLQATFLWFVMLFPALIVTAFFLTLNFNARVLYAPADFEKEENFLKTLRGTMHSVTADLQTAKAEIMAGIMEDLSMTDAPLRSRIAALIERQLDPVQNKVDIARKQIERLPLPTVAELPYKQPCPKCGEAMTLNHDEQIYGCTKCEHWEYANCR